MLHSLYNIKYTQFNLHLIHGIPIQRNIPFTIYDIAYSHFTQSTLSLYPVHTRFTQSTLSLYPVHTLPLYSPFTLHLYKALVLPILDYSSSIWDPHQKCHITSLERAQNFAARIVSNDWTGSPTAIKARLGWQALAQRRLAQKICLCRRIISGSSLLPADTFKPHLSGPSPEGF